MLDTSASPHASNWTSTTKLWILSTVAFVLLTARTRGLAQSGTSQSSEQPHPSPAMVTNLREPMRLTVSDPGRLLSLPGAGIPPSLVPLFGLGNSDIKFQLPVLMANLRDNRHEGWVLAAYPDPKTSRPLIGAGFSLDVEETEHVQRDPLNPYKFLEPSSAQLWQGAGFDPARLQQILGQYDRDLKKWGKKSFRKKIKKNRLEPQVSEEEALTLLRISAVQAIHNARAYCRGFDQLTASQQMALTQLVYQMGINLEEFTTFLSTLNEQPHLQDASLDISASGQRQYWTAVQLSLIQSQWARKYSSRAISVIAMFDPDYAENPRAAEQRVKAVLHPAKHKNKHKKSKTRTA